MEYLTESASRSAYALGKISFQIMQESYVDKARLIEGFSQLCECLGELRHVMYFSNDQKDCVERFNEIKALHIKAMLMMLSV